MSDGHSFYLPAYDTTFECERLRRDHQELIGELTVRCGLPGALTVNGCLNVADFNFSSLRARQDRAKLLATRAATNAEVDWFGLLENFCQQVFIAERNGSPAIKLKDAPLPERDDEIKVDGLAFPRRHPSILFGDGGSAKSYTALYLAGRLCERGLRVAFFDWELAGEDHRERLDRLFAPILPEELYYCRCERALTAEVDRLRHVVTEYKIDYAVFDSVAFACDGRPEDAEIAGRYFRAVRSLKCGSLHIAHVNKSEEADKKPFGSSFWHNGARSTWNVQADEQTGRGILNLGFFNRKSNLGPLHQPVGFNVFFDKVKTLFTRAEVGDNGMLAQKLSVRQRMLHILKNGSMDAEEIAQAIEADSETVKREARRRKHDFVCLACGRIGLLAV